MKRQKKSTLFRFIFLVNCAGDLEKNWCKESSLRQIIFEGCSSAMSIPGLVTRLITITYVLGKRNKRKKKKPPNNSQLRKKKSMQMKTVESHLKHSRVEQAPSGPPPPLKSSPLSLTREKERVKKNAHFTGWRGSSPNIGSFSLVGKLTANVCLFFSLPFSDLWSPIVGEDRAPAAGAPC